MAPKRRSSQLRHHWRVFLQWVKDPRVRALITLMLLGAIIFLARDHYHFLEEGWAAMLQANNWYILAAVVAMGLSMVAQAEVMVALLRPAGVPVKRSSANALGLSANAWSSTFPGGPAISAAMIFREQMKWGATGVVASWYLVISGALSGASMALLGFGAVFFLQANVHVFSLTASLLVLVSLMLVANWASRHPDKVQAKLLSAMTWFNTKRRKPAERFHEQIRSFAQQLRAVDLSPKWLSYAVSVSLLNWVLEIVCLFLCILAIGAEPSIAGAILAFIVAKLMGQAQITPGGLGPVDITLTTMLVGTAGLGSGQAVAAVIVFRMVSFALLTLVGWLVFLWTFVRPEEEGADDTGDPGRRRSGTGLTVRQITGGSAARDPRHTTSDQDDGVIDRLPRYPGHQETDERRNRQDHGEPRHTDAPEPETD
ncbi:lysylphosphatidylglycerol synthase transmembrane domain-containing protein [Corynebacterium kalidii]|uniref:YbhN family protein n=1 Tax=Corynebacterium kalidii TaxID=2931982 RepID=A0A9X2AXK8_9CORY|nr:YbhN family protein [Corynebacterium kalidii]MCJ7857171.1 YbhN family protein [Corynebacterium kalidii]